MAKNTLKTIGASNHSLEERSDLDYYGTSPQSTKALLKVESFDNQIWEPACGHNLIVNVLREAGYTVKASDLFDYGYQDELLNFLDFGGSFAGDIITNPPYALAAEFAIKALKVITPGHKVAMFLRTLFLEGTKRYDKLFKDSPPKYIYVFSNRQVSDKNDDFTHGSAVSYSWFVWEKGFTGDPIIKWIRSETIKVEEVGPKVCELF